MKIFLKSVLSSGFLILLMVSPNQLTKASDIQSMSNSLQKSLNSKNKSSLYEFFSKPLAKNITKEFDTFTKIFPNAKWIITPSKQLKDQRQSLAIMVTGNKEINGQEYSLISKQKIAITTRSGKIISQEILSDISILQTGDKSLKVTIKIPDIVLTGSTYDIDIIVDKPLNDAVIAGGLIALRNKPLNNILSSSIALKPMSSGGIFKSVRAPLNSGNQRWAAFLAHPDGLISITKMVRVVSDKNNLTN